jgi:hypothetical protein
MMAAVRLRADLWQAIAEFPDARHVVIAHSHGGNVALYALKDPELRSQIAGVVTLATPFFTARDRNLGWIVSLAGIGAGFHIMYWFLLLAVLILARGMSIFGIPSADSGWDLAVSFAGRLLWAFVLGRFGFLLGTLAGDWIIRKGNRWLRRQRRRALRCYPRLVCPGLNLLNIQAPRDEARFLLRFFSAVADVPLRLLFHPIAVAASFIWSAVALTLWVNGIGKQLESVPWWAWILTVVWVLNFSVFLVLVQFVLFAPVVTILQTLTRGHIAGFGLERFTINTVVLVRSEHEPKIRGAKVTRPDCEYREWRKQYSHRLDMHHSWVYKAPGPAAEIQRFLRDLPLETPKRPVSQAFEVAPALRQIRSAFRTTWIERGLAALALAGIIFCIATPASIDGDWLLPGAIQGDHTVILGAPFVNRRLIETRGAVVAVDFSELSQTRLAEETQSLWRRVTSSAQTTLPYLYMRVVRLPGESAALPPLRQAPSLEWSLPDSRAGEELRSICREESEKLYSSRQPVPAGSVQVESLDPLTHPCSAIVPLDRIGGRVGGVFPKWQAWNLHGVPISSPAAQEFAVPPPDESHARVQTLAAPLPDDAHLSFGKTFSVDKLPSPDLTNPHDVARHSVFLYKQGRARELPARPAQVDGDASLDRALTTFVDEFGPDLEKFRDTELRMEFVAYLPPKAPDGGSSIWYYYLKAANGEYLPRKPWVSLRRSVTSKQCWLTGIFANSEDPIVDIPAAARRK